MEEVPSRNNLLIRKVKEFIGVMKVPKKVQVK